MNHRLGLLPIACGLALLASACDRPAPNNTSEPDGSTTMPAPATTDPNVDPATPQAIPVPDPPGPTGSATPPGATTDGTTGDGTATGGDTSGAAR